jgi:hypothetical protein
MNNSSNTLSTTEVESATGAIEPTKRIDDVAGRMRRPDYQPSVVEIPTSGQRLHRTSPKLEAAAGQKARRTESYSGCCGAIILHGDWSTPTCSGGPFQARFHLSKAGNDLKLVAGSGSMRRLSGAIPATACTGEWLGQRGKGQQLIPTVGRGDWWSGVRMSTKIRRRGGEAVAAGWRSKILGEPTREDIWGPRRPMTKKYAPLKPFGLRLESVQRLAAHICSSKAVLGIG